MDKFKELEDFDLDEPVGVDVAVEVDDEPVAVDYDWDYAVVVESYDWIIAECGQDFEAAKEAQSKDLDAMIIKRYIDADGNVVNYEVVDDGYSEYDQDYDYSDEDLYDPFEVDESVSVNVNADSAEEMVNFAKAMFGDNIDFFDQDFDTVPEAECEVPAVVEEPECEGPECDVECEGPECEGPNPEPEFEEPVPEEPDSRQDKTRQDTKEVDLAEDHTGNPEESPAHLKESADEEDDMTDEEFVEAFGKALAEKRAAKNLEEDKDDFNPDDAASDELEAEADDAAEISEISLRAYRDSLKENKLTESPTDVVALCNFDIQEYDIPTSKGENDVTVEVDILGPTAEDWGEGKEVTLVCETYYNTNDLYFDKEEDGEPTYVPYGEQSVMYDNGKGQITGVDVDANTVDIDDWYFKELNGFRKLTDAEAAKILEVSEDELKDIIDAATHDAAVFVADYLRDYLPEYANDWDWDDDRYDDWD